MDLKINAVLGGWFLVKTMVLCGRSEHVTVRFHCSFQSDDLIN